MSLCSYTDDHDVLLYRRYYKSSHTIVLCRIIKIPISKLVLIQILYIFKWLPVKLTRIVSKGVYDILGRRVHEKDKCLYRLYHHRSDIVESILYQIILAQRKIIQYINYIEVVERINMNIYVLSCLIIKHYLPEKCTPK